VFLRRLFRYLFCLVLAIVVLGFALPFFGIDQAHFLPPTWVYKKAQGQVAGIIYNKYSVQTNDPFRIGQRLYFWQYYFYADAIQPGKTKPVQTEFYGEVRVPQEVYDTIKQNQGVTVRYEKTYPWINGLDDPPAGLGCGPASNILSGWLLWLGAAAVLGFVFMGILQNFLPKEDI
jgi:hypothetical protein